MSTTTIRLPRELKERVARAAERAGTTPHGFILEAIAEKAGVNHRIKIFEGTNHGYTFPERPSYAPAASEQTWTMLFDLWDRNLK